MIPKKYLAQISLDTNTSHFFSKAVCQPNFSYTMNHGNSRQIFQGNHLDKVFEELLKIATVKINLCKQTEPKIKTKYPLKSNQKTAKPKNHIQWNI